MVASSKIQIIKHLEGGIIKEILTRTGQSVSAGDPLIVFDMTKFVKKENVSCGLKSVHLYCSN